jgi:hypothetical protein
VGTCARGQANAADIGRALFAALIRLALVMGQLAMGQAPSLFELRQKTWRPE